MRRTIEQITDISCGNHSRTPLSLTSSFESWHSEISQQCSQHSQRRETRNLEDGIEIQGQTRQHSKLINLLECVNKLDCDTAVNNKKSPERCRTR